MHDQNWRVSCDPLSSSDFDEALLDYKHEVKMGTIQAKIREHFAKELHFELDRIRDIEHRLDDQMRYSIKRVLFDNFNGTGANLKIADPLESDHEIWETNLRKLFSAIFQFIENPSDATHCIMWQADPQTNGMYYP